MTELDTTQREIETLRDAILAHGMEGKRARESYERLSEVDKVALIAFLESL